MINENQIKIVLEKFKRASSEFDFNFELPYFIKNDDKLCFFGHLYKAGVHKGAVITLMCFSLTYPS